MTAVAYEALVRRIEVLEAKLDLIDPKCAAQYQAAVEKAATNATIYARLPEPLRSAAIASHKALHMVWTKAAHADEYAKQEWRELNNAIENLIRLAEEK